MSVFVDTTAFYAVLDARDRNHEIAKKLWGELLSQGETVVTSNYAIVETDALLRKRAGMEIVRRFHTDVVPAVSVVWVDEPVHNAGLSAALATGRAGASLVDCVGFTVMRQLGIAEVFAFDKHFADQGFACRP